jgi:hypothetical protein
VLPAALKAAVRPLRESREIEAVGDWLGCGSSPFMPLLSQPTTKIPSPLMQSSTAKRDERTD